MEAVILVGGQGNRLRPLTIETPKPMLPAAGVPFLAHQLARLRAVGVDHVVLATSYRSEVFTDYFGDGAELGLRVDYVTETEPLGTGGGIRNVAPRLESAPDEPVLVLNGDILSGHDIEAQLAAHRAADAVVTLHLVRVDDPRAFGSVPTDDRGRVTAFREKTPEPETDQVNAGCYVFARHAIDAIPADTVVSVERETFPQLLADDAVVLGYVDPAYWIDVGTPAAFVRASADLVRGVLPVSAVAQTGEFLVRGDVHDSAYVAGGSVVDVGATVDEGARVESSILMAGARVGAGAVVIRSVVGEGAGVGPGCVLTDAVVGNRASVVRIWPDVTLPDGAVRFSSDR